MSTTCKVDLPNLADIPATPLVEVARHVAALRREQDRLVDEDTDSSHELADQLGDLLWDIDDQVLARSPSTVADAAVMLLAIASSLRPAMDSLDNRSTMMDAWLGLGRVTKFLADAGRVDPAEIGSGYWDNSITGLDRGLAAQWWLQRFLQDGGTLILSETGKVGYFTPEDDAEQAERFRALHEERVALDADLLAEKAGLLAWQGLGALGLYHQTIAGRRWGHRLAGEPHRGDLHHYHGDRDR